MSGPAVLYEVPTTCLRASFLGVNCTHSDICKAREWGKAGGGVNENNSPSPSLFKGNVDSHLLPEESVLMACGEGQRSVRGAFGDVPGQLVSVAH